MPNADRRRKNWGKLAHRVSRPAYRSQDTKDLMRVGKDEKKSQPLTIRIQKIAFNATKNLSNGGIEMRGLGCKATGKQVMKEQPKLSIRFFNDREVRAVWDDEHSKWWFNVLDIVGVLNEEPDYAKVRNYWKYLKAKLKKENNQLVSATTQLKFMAADGKKYATDTLDSGGIIALAKHFPNNRAIKFLDWFLYSDTSIDGQSKKKAYTLFESNLINDFEIGTSKGLQQIHAYLFGGLYDFAGQIREKSISKGGYQFVYAQHLKSTLQKIDFLPQATWDEICLKYTEMNKAHPFMEGNGRSTRIWLDMMLKKQLKKCVDWSKISKENYMNAMIISTVDGSVLKQLLETALTAKINDREMFMKGIDYSYYYEE